MKVQMTIFTLLTKIYGPFKKNTYRQLSQHLSNICSDIEVDVKLKGLTDRGWIQIEVSGEDASFFSRYLEKRFGKTYEKFEDLNVNSIIRGRVINSGDFGFGLFVDVGITSPKMIDCFIPLYALRKQLLGSKSIPVREVINKFCLHDFLPLEIKIVEKNTKLFNVRAQLSDRQVTNYVSWLETDLNRVIVLGAPYSQVLKALKKAKVSSDSVKVQSLGLLEHVITCMQGTDGPGIVSLIGKFLPRVPLHIFNRNG